ncbi:hypothetical protein [Anaerotignum propionicum]|uniref:Uncharacterized protein n=1 Tax=Anaerotignum propionicum DSM 1682 TaxID=991789 RepID=A0ABM5Y7P2_ANAPI|nr:hypothetical protein [Anaerotignum propionicum]AMJ39776.1 hypothetical protein CPRO_01520 [Anaerotignum propionicum DSM 1682]
MEKTILKSIYVSNFGPFADMVEFTLEAEKGKKEYIDNLIFKEDKIMFLIKCLIFMVQMVRENRIFVKL